MNKNYWFLSFLTFGIGDALTTTYSYFQMEQGNGVFIESGIITKYLVDYVSNISKLFNTNMSFTLLMLIIITKLILMKIIYDISKRGEHVRLQNKASAITLIILGVIITLWNLKTII